MGSSVFQNVCKTVAIRYRFIEKKGENGKAEIAFLPHLVQKCELDVKTCDESEDIATEVDVNYLRSLDPKEWKKQDHYQVLGLQNLRNNATDENIKAAYRKIVLKHHPDKRKALGEEIWPDDDYYTCITMAYEVLGNPIKRRSYDSVDPEFDNSLPSSNELKNDFYKIAKYYFDLNSRWSEIVKTPSFGDENSPRENVDNFYSFWYNFKSWREFSYEDEEDKDKCQDRDERRMCEKLNKVERQRKKKEEMSRIRNLVDLVYNVDPRILKFKQEDKDRKMAAKKAKQSAAQAKKEEEERIMKEMKEAKEKAEIEERARLEVKKQEREAQKKAIKRERKTLRETCKTNNYFANDEEENLIHMQGVDKICEIFTLAEIENLNKTLQKNGKADFKLALEECEKRIEEERKKILEAAYQKSNIEDTKTLKNGISTKANWTSDHLQLLIKAVNVFPAGTNQRWDVIANFINQHGSIPDGCMKFNSKDVLSKAKDLQNTDFSKSDLKEAANKRAFDNFEKEKKPHNIVENSDITKKIDEEAQNSKIPKGKQESNANIGKQEVKTEIPWTSLEQQMLEQALKTYPASKPDRWDRVAECVPNRTKKECMKRFKELVEIVKAKKAAQAALNSK